MAGAYYDGGPWRPSTTTTTAYTGTAGTQAAVGAQTRIVRVILTTSGFIAFGATATTAGVFMPADVPDYFRINPGETVSAIQLSSGGNMYVTEMV